jgi:hypothetical protein
MRAYVSALVPIYENATGRRGGVPEHTSRNLPTVPSPDYGGMPKAIGRERTNPRSRTKGRMVRWFVGACLPASQGRRSG